MALRPVLAVIVFAVGVCTAGAEVYQWVDEKGVVTFKDTPPPPSKTRKKVKTYKDGDFDPAPPAPPASASSKRRAAGALPPAAAKTQRFGGTVELYVTDWCGYCKQAVAYLKEKGIPYVAYNIERDSAARRRHEELGGRGVPLIVVGSNRMSGFSPQALEHYLSLER